MKSPNEDDHISELSTPTTVFQQVVVDYSSSEEDKQSSCGASEGDSDFEEKESIDIDKPIEINIT